jgi:hypothetical protein
MNFYCARHHDRNNLNRIISVLNTLSLSQLSERSLAEREREREREREMKKAE